VVIVLKTDGSKKANNCDIFWRYSSDGGETWSAPTDAGVNTSGGEGRKIPRLCAINNRFYLIYDDNEQGDISVGILDLGPGGINERRRFGLSGKTPTHPLQKNSMTYYSLQGKMLTLDKRHVTNVPIIVIQGKGNPRLVFPDKTIGVKQR